ncbi:MAG: 4Fe-4S dicluster domain-containing protein [Candidatus Omnitrophica bacterium]|nr:4Fe-4S dicluster domain-containing protein [Candidatus Omnitrophota bacterium]
MQQYFYLKKEDLGDLLSEINKSHALFIPSKKDDDYIYLSFSQLQPEEIIYSIYRGVEPIKSFLTHSREIVNEYFQSFDSSAEAKPIAVFGVKNCDLSSLTLQDFVFEQGIEADPIYKKRRENLLIISSDCTGFKKTCFCLAVGNKPYPEKNFDINLSPINNGFVVEVGSSKGETLIRRLSQYFTAATTGQIAGSKIKRDNVVNDLSQHLASVNMPPKDALQKNVREGYESGVWKEQMLTCVECGACNFICPSCHCFLLADDMRENKSRRIRIWDSCLYANYSRVAGGANPLNTRAKRLRNRFMKKFDFFPDNLGQFGCTGCGRCIEACPAKIDIREVLKALVKK